MPRGVMKPSRLMSVMVFDIAIKFPVAYSWLTCRETMCTYLTRCGLSMPFKHRLTISTLIFLVFKKSGHGLAGYRFIGLGVKISEEKSEMDCSVFLTIQCLLRYKDFCRLSQSHVLMAIFLSCSFQIWNVRMCLY